MDEISKQKRFVKKHHVVAAIFVLILIGLFIFLMSLPEDMPEAAAESASQPVQAE